MNCKDFKEIADSYLSNELLVETNHDVLRHLESCSNCRGELASRRELREQLKFVVINAPQSQIDPRFAASLKRDLRDRAFRKERAWSAFGTRAIFAGAAAAILIAIFIGVSLRKPDAIQTVEVQQTPVSPDNIVPDTRVFQQASFISARKDAVDDHKHCALTHDLEEMPISLKEAGKRFGSANNGFDSAVLEPLREAFGEDAKFIKAHFCIINGRRFSHVVVQYRKKVVSVLLTKREDDDARNESDVASCDNAGDLQVACFVSGRYNVFVVSDLLEDDNLLMATTISASVKNHIAQKA